MPAGPAALATLLLTTTPFVSYRCFSLPLLVPLCWSLLFLLRSSPCQCWCNPHAGPGGAQLKAHWRGPMPHSSKAEGRHCLWMGETSVAQGTPLHRAQTLAGTNLTDCSCEQRQRAVGQAGTIPGCAGPEPQGPEVRAGTGR